MLSPFPVTADGSLVVYQQESEWPEAKQACQNMSMRLAVNPGEVDILSNTRKWVISCEIIVLELNTDKKI